MKTIYYLTCALVLLFTLIVSPVKAATVTVLGQFGHLNGFTPQAPLVQGIDGNFYGTTAAGGNTVGSGYGTIYRITPTGEITTLFSLANDQNGGTPQQGLALGRDGNFYGVTTSGGSSGQGTLFKITSAGVLTTLSAFTPGSGGFQPNSALIQGADGNFYGTTYGGGTGGQGVVYRLTSAGVLTTVTNFNGNNGSNPIGLVLGRDGNFYGTTINGGSSNAGTVFQLTPSGSLTTLASFTGANGVFPDAALVQGDDGSFYGTTSQGGQTNNGCVFKVSPTGVLTALFSFNSYANATGLTEGPDGNFYGETQSGGTSNLGTAFQITPSGRFTTLISFEGASGSAPLGGLTRGSNGQLYGVTSQGGSLQGGTIFSITTTGSLTTLLSFDATQGSQPEGGLLQAADGNFYGTTFFGGTANSGTVFKVSANGSLSTLASFDEDSGSSPDSSLIQGVDGTLYGTSYEGPNILNQFINLNASNGQIYAVSLNGSLSNAVTFDWADGSVPFGVIKGKDGNFYGTTRYGGNLGYGVIYKSDTLGNVSVLASFNGTNGSYPTEGLIQATDGNFYGTTAGGGSAGYGVVYKVTPSGVLTDLISFTGGSKGSYPYSVLSQGGDGNLYGTTAKGGSSGKGTLFRITPAGVLTILASFTGTNGANPYTGLLLAKDGNFYGETEEGGSFSKGTIFELTPTGNLTTLISLDGANGAYPRNPLIQGKDGNLYGATISGGNTNQGVVFRVNLAPLPPIWTQADIGSPVVAGTASYSSGIYTLVGGGADIWNSADQFQFAYQSWTGDGSIIARVDSQTGGKSGLMFRAQVPPSSAAAGSQYVDMVFHSGTPKCEYRSLTGQRAQNAGSTTSIKTPYWAKLSRRGNVFTGSISPDGVTWTQIGQAVVNMPNAGSFGLVQCAHSTNGSSTGKFDNVLVSATTP